MGEPLSKNSKIKCSRHGTQPPTFICRHLQFGTGLGFHQPADGPDPEYPFDQAWCDECNEVFLKEGGEWNDVSEGFAEVMMICAGCFEGIRSRNSSSAQDATRP